MHADCARAKVFLPEGDGSKAVLARAFTHDVHHSSALLLITKARSAGFHYRAHQRIST